MLQMDYCLRRKKPLFHWHGQSDVMLPFLNGCPDTFRLLDFTRAGHGLFAQIYRPLAIMGHLQCMWLTVPPSMCHVDNDLTLSTD